MTTVIIVVHLMIVIAMIAVILLQRSEGGALGIGGGGGGGGGGMFSARGSANLLTRATTVLAVTFFVTSLGLGLLAKQQSGAPSILDGAAPAGPAGIGGGAVRGTGEGLLETLQIQSGETPTGEQDAAPTGIPLAPPATDNAVPAPPAPADGAAAPQAPAFPNVPNIPQVPTGQ